MGHGSFYPHKHSTHNNDEISVVFHYWIRSNGVTNTSTSKTSNPNYHVLHNFLWIMSCVKLSVVSKTWLTYREVLICMYVCVCNVFGDGLEKINEKFMFCAISFGALRFEMPWGTMCISWHFTWVEYAYLKGSNDTLDSISSQSR